MSSGIGSSNTSPFNTPRVREAQQREQSRTPVPESPFAGTAERAHESMQADLAIAARRARQHDPETYAKVKRLAGNVPPEVAIRNLTEVEHTQKLHALRDMFGRDRRLADHFALNPEDLKYGEAEEISALWDKSEQETIRQVRQGIAGLYGPPTAGEAGGTPVALSRQIRQLANTTSDQRRSEELNNLATNIGRGMDPGTAMTEFERVLVEDYQGALRAVPYAPQLFGQGLLGLGYSGFTGLALMDTNRDIDRRNNLLEIIGQGVRPTTAARQESQASLDAAMSRQERLDTARERGQISEEDYIRLSAETNQRLSELQTDLEDRADWTDEEREAFAVQAREEAADMFRRQAEGYASSQEELELIQDISERLRTGQELNISRLDWFNTPEAATERGAYDFGQTLLQLSEDWFDVPDDVRESVLADVISGVGTFTGFAALSAATGMGGTLFAASMSGISETYDRAIQAGMSEEEAQALALQGIGPGLIQVAPVELVMRRLPRGAREEFAKMFQEIAIAGGSEAAVEAAGQLWQNAIEMDYNPDRELMDGVAYAGGISGASAILFRQGIAGTMSMTRALANRKARQSIEESGSQQAAALTGALFEEAQNNKMVERDPEAAARVIDTRHPEEKRYVPAQALMSYYQEAGQDPMAAPLTNWQQRVSEALRTQTDVELTLGEFVAHFGRDPKAQPLLELTRHDPKAWTPQEYQTAREIVQRATQGRMAESQAAAGEPVRAQIAEILQGANLPAEQVDAYSRLFSEFFASMASQASEAGIPMTAQDMLARYNFQTESGEGVATPEDLRVETELEVNNLQEQIAAANQLIAEASTPEQAAELEAEAAELQQRLEERQSRLTLEQPAYHGSPHQFEEFLLRFIGAGEGNQAFGWGLYFAQRRGIAEGYREQENRRRSQRETVEWQNMDRVDEILAGTRAIQYGDQQVPYVNDFGRDKIIPDNWESMSREEQKFAKAISSYFRQGRSEIIWRNAKEYGAYINNFYKKQVEKQEAEIQTLESIKENIPEELNTEKTRDQRNRQIDVAKWELALLKKTAEANKSVDWSLVEPDVGLVKTKPGRTFKVDVPEDADLLALDVPVTASLTPEQIQRVEDFLGLPTLMDRERLLKRPLNMWTGRDLYEGIEWYYKQEPEMFADAGVGLGERADKAASLWLKSIGKKGLKYYDRVSRKKDENQSYNFVIWDEEAIRVMEYWQGGENSPRGQVEFMGQTIPIGNDMVPDSPFAIIRLFDRADKSTMLHEFGHFSLEVMRDLAPSVPSIQQDLEIIGKHVGAPDLVFKREHHEKMAQSFEAYLFTGMAPSNALVPVFRKLRNWLKSIYKTIKNLGGPVNPELARVFDRMFSAEERFDQIADEANYRQLFESAEAMGVDEAEYESYLTLVQRMRQEAQDRARVRIGGQQERLSRGWFKQIENELAKEAEAKLRKEAPWKHDETFANGLRLSRDQLRNAYGPATIKKLPRNSVAANGTDLGIVAEILEYNSVDEMVYDLTQRGKIKERAKELAQAEMARRYGENYSDSEVVDAAIEQELADQARTTVLAKELAALRKRSGRTADEDGPKALAKRIARETLEAKPLKLINMKVYTGEARRAAARAEQAIVQGDWAAAAEAKRQQLFAQALASEAATVLKRVEQIRRKAGKFQKGKVGGVAPDYVEAIRAMLDKYQFKKMSNRQLQRKVNLREFLQAEEDSGAAVVVPEYLRADARQVHYRELTYAEISDIGDALDNMEFLGRRKSKFKASKEAKEFEAVKRDALTQLEQVPRRPRDKRSMTEEESRLRYKLSDIMANLLKPEQIITWLDNDNLQGAFTQNLWLPMQRSFEEARDLEKEYNLRLKEAFNKLDPKYMREVITFPDITDMDTSSTNLGKPLKLSREEIFAVALNLGNASNEKKLMEGERWTPQQLQQIISKLTPDDALQIQQIWDVIGDLWPRIAALEKRLTGVEPKLVEAQPVNIAGVPLRGGYYPVVYDFQARRGENLESNTEPRDRQLVTTDERGNITFKFTPLNSTPGTDHKYTVARKRVARPMRLSLSVVPQHVHKVIHDLTHREAVRDVYKLLSDPDIRRGIEDTQGREEYQQLMHWLRAVASPDSLEDSSILGRGLKHFRTNMTIMGLGFGIGSAVAQVFGVFPSAQKMGWGPMLHGMNNMARDPVGLREFATTKSAELRHRFNNQDRDISDTVNNWKDHDSWQNKVRLAAFVFISTADGIIATSVWSGAYAKYRKDNPGHAEQSAIDYADYIVRMTQGTGAVKDMARVSTVPWFKMFTLFYSFFSAQHNMQVDLYRKTKRDIVNRHWKDLAYDFARWMNLVVLPATLSAIAMGQGPEEEDLESPLGVAMWATGTSVGYATGGIPIARDVVNSLTTGFDYQLAPLARIGEQLLRAQQEATRAITDEPDFRGLTTDFLKAYGYTAGMPVGQFTKSLDAIWGGIENGDFEIQDIIYGRRDKDQ